MWAIVKCYRYLRPVATCKKALSWGVTNVFLAVILQESGGCVRALTTNNGIVKVGLMQSYNGTHSCYGETPCPQPQILAMVHDGTAGTPCGWGLQQIMSNLSGGVSKFYTTAGLYKSGSMTAIGHLLDENAPQCYASDIANRLIGWSDGPSGCKPQSREIMY